MSSVWRVLRNPEPATVAHLARYLLFFFSGENPQLWALLGRVGHGASLSHDLIGRWWAEDATRTAWALYVRYRRYGDEQWQAGWQYRESWLEWMSGEDATPD